MFGKINYRKLVRTLLKQRLFLLVVIASCVYCASLYATAWKVSSVHHKRKVAEKNSLEDVHEPVNAPVNPEDILEGQVDMVVKEEDRNGPDIGDFREMRGRVLHKDDWMVPEVKKKKKKKKMLTTPKLVKQNRDEKVRRRDEMIRNRLRKRDMMQPHGNEPNESDEGREVNKTKTYGNVKLPPFVEHAEPGDPGEMGVAYKMDLDKLSPEEKEQKALDFEKHYFDEWVSRQISVHRTLDDRLPSGCLDQDSTGLPEASVIIVFHNEAWTTLLRSIHSILDRTPESLLKEIILLDDSSDMDHLGIPLESYVQPLAKVRLIRTNGRMGLIRARNLGVKLATADVIVFLDSHIECFPGWFEPLVRTLQSEPKALVFPQIEFISSTTFSCGLSGQVNVVGGFYPHTLTFAWLYERKLKVVTKTENHPSPTMPGGLYAITKEWFTKLGGYDPGLEIWGGENIEMSFKAWMCGGSVQLVSCSRVGHIFRRKNPNLGRYPQTHANSVRVAEVWMDSYKHFFYEKIGYKVGEFGNVKHRHELRRSLSCHSFSWYLDNVYPEMKNTMDTKTVYSGRIIHFVTKKCMDRLRATRLQACSNYQSYQLWQLSSKGYLESGDGVLNVKFSKNNTVSRIGLSPKAFSESSSFSAWIYDQSHRLNLKRTELCLESQPSTLLVRLIQCSDSDLQKWTIETREMLQEAMMHMHVPIDWSR